LPAAAALQPTELFLLLALCSLLVFVKKFPFVRSVLYLFAFTFYNAERFICESVQTQMLTHKARNLGSERERGISLPSLRVVAHTHTHTQLSQSSSSPGTSKCSHFNFQLCAPVLELPQRQQPCMRKKHWGLLNTTIVFLQKSSNFKFTKYQALI
jgi:hypothetical protein